MSSTLVAPPYSDPDDPSSPPAAAIEPDEPVDQPQTEEAATPDPRWVLPALIVLLVATGVLYIWGLGQSGWANSFYSAAVQAGSKSWKAFFFGSSDASNFIMVDKPPVSLWAMDIAARIFGVNAWSVLVPQALEGVAAVFVLYKTVRRWFSPGAGLLAGAVMALTPVAALMFRFNNPDAMLVLLLTAAAYALTRALEAGSTKWLVLSTVCIGFAFLTKTLQAFVIVPGFAVVYLIAGPPKILKRLWQLAIAAVGLIVSSLWWVVVVQLWPASSRPYVGGSTNNSEWNLIFGYNGLGRVTGNERGSVGGRPSPSGMWGPTGWLRLFNNDFGGQSSWLIPAALLLGAAGLVVTLRRPRTDRTRAALLLWGGWLVVTGVVLSLSKGIIHPYYTVALTPAIGALVGIGGMLMWQHRSHIGARIALAAAVVVSAWWAVQLLNRSPQFEQWLKPLVIAAAIVATIGLVFGPALNKYIVAVGVAAALVAGLAIPAAYSINTAAVPHSGSIPSAGPAVVIRRGTGFGPFGLGPPPNANNRPRGNAPGAVPPGGGGAAQMQGPPIGAGPSLFVRPGTGWGASNGVGLGGLLNASHPSRELINALRQDASKFDWVLATIGSNQAAGYQLASGEPVMAIGGFNGTDPAPSLTQFEKYVDQGRIHYFITGGTGGQSLYSGQIANWVRGHFVAVYLGDLEVYDLTLRIS